MTAIAVNTTLSSFPILGYMPMPEDFPYQKIAHIGRPKHDKYSEFGLRHPSMPCSKRAKIFAPFDALAGFDERIERKELLYEPRRSIGEEKRAVLNRNLNLLNQLFRKNKKAKRPAPKVSVTYFAPCTDPENDACGKEGRYCTIQGTVTGIDTELAKVIFIDGQPIHLEDLFEISCNIL